MKPLETLPFDYQQKYYQSGHIRRRELCDFNQCEARFAELERNHSVKNISSEVTSYNKTAQKFGYNIHVISRGDRIFAYKTDDEHEN